MHIHMEEGGGGGGGGSGGPHPQNQSCGFRWVASICEIRMFVSWKMRKLLNNELMNLPKSYTLYRNFKV